MQAAMTIDAFNALLASDKEESPLLKALRQLTTIEKPEDIRALAEVLSGWTGWGT